MSGKMSKPVGDIGGIATEVVQESDDTVLTSKSTMDLAIEIAGRPHVLGAIVVTYDRTGKLEIGFGLRRDNNERTIEIMGDVAKVIKDHMDAKFPDAPGPPGSGAFADDETKN